MTSSTSISGSLSGASIGGLSLSVSGTSGLELEGSGALLHGDSSRSGWNSRPLPCSLAGVRPPVLCRLFRDGDELLCPLFTRALSSRTCPCVSFFLHAECDTSCLTCSAKHFGGCLSCPVGGSTVLDGDGPTSCIGTCSDTFVKILRVLVSPPPPPPRPGGAPAQGGGRGGGV